MFLILREMQRLHPKPNAISFLVKGIIMGIRKFFRVVVFLTASFIVNTRVSAFTQVIVFGDSLSDDGNIAHRARDTVGFSYPSRNFNYSNYRFTDDTNTAPAANLYTGTWHEQLAKTFLSLPKATDSLDGGTNYSFGDPNRVAGLDLASANYRSQLNSVVASVISGYAANGITIHVYGFDVWLDVIRALGQPRRYGFVNTTVPAQDQSGVNPDTYLFWDDIHPTTGGHHQLAGEANRLLSGQIAPLAKATNISTRGLVGTGEDVLIAGFIISGSQPKKVIVRALGPTLGTLGVSGVLADPTIVVVNSSKVVVASNDDWRSTQEAQIAASGFAPRNNLESAIIATLPPGSYSAVVSGKNGGTGIGLVDVYELDATTSIFQDLSTRGFVGTGDNVLIGGLIIGNGEQPLIVVRAIGPTLGSFGITQPLQDPTLEVRDANGGLISFENDWQDNTPTAVKAVLLQPQDSREAAVVLSLPAGNYTAIVRGKNGTTGVALVEAYRIR